jgi:hypothetical protein
MNPSHAFVKLQIITSDINAGWQIQEVLIYVANALIYHVTNISQLPGDQGVIMVTAYRTFHMFVVSHNQL